MSSLEDAVRRSLAQAVSGAPGVPHDVASAAIRRAHRSRRTRWGGTLVIVVLVVFAGVVSIARPRTHVVPTASLHRPQTAPVLSSAPLPQPYSLDLAPTEATDRMAAVHLPVDVIADGVLLTAKGGQVNVTRVGEVSAGYRAEGGWLLVSSSTSKRGTEQRLWFASPTAAPRELLSGGADAVVVDPAGARVAWRTESRVSTAAFVAGKLVQRTDTAAPSDAVPVGFAGEAVRLARSTAGGGLVGQDVWYPERGSYTSTWNNDAVGVYGSLPDGTTLVGQVTGKDGGKDRCLALFDLPSLTATKAACGLGLTADAQGWVSPGGRWLVAEAAAGTGTQAVLIDLTVVFGGATRTVPVGPPPTGGAAWEDPNTVVRAARGALQRLRLDRLWIGAAGGLEDIPIAGVHGLIVVTRLAM